MISRLCGAAILCVAISGAHVTTASAQTAAAGPYYATPSWDQTLPSSSRFIVLTNFASNAVLDRETGLVWERSPSATVAAWANAQTACITRVVGGRKGWRVPTVQDLSSLLEPSANFADISLQAGHPFLNVSTDAFYWSATSVDADPTRAWATRFSGAGFVAQPPKSSTLPVWCVRGGTAVDAQ